MRRKSPAGVWPKGYRAITFVYSHCQLLVMQNLYTIIVAFSAVLTLSSCSSVDECRKGVTVQNTSVSLEKGMCFGKCPVYSGTILGDGQIMYDGRRFTEREGIYVGALSESKLCELITLLRQADLANQPSEKLDNVPDAPISELRVVFLGKVYTYKWNMGTPDALKRIETFIEDNTHENQSLRPMGN